MVVETLAKPILTATTRKCPHCASGIQRLKTLVYNSVLTFGPSESKTEFKWHCFNCALFEAAGDEPVGN